MITLDFETRSHLDLKKVGAWVYATHPTTNVAMLAYAFGDNEPDIWYLGEDPPKDLLYSISKGEPIEAHNAFFERVIWHHICHKRMGWLAVQDHQWRCSAAKAAAVVFPRKLEHLSARICPDNPKDAEGHALMLPFSQYKIDSPEIVERIGQYCLQDVRAEQSVSAKLPKLHPFEQEVWHTDQTINFRGVHCDREFIKKALNLKESASQILNDRLFELSGVERATQRAQVLSFLKSIDPICKSHLYDTQKSTISWLLSMKDISPKAREILQIMRAVNKTSTRKYQRAIECLGDDDRIRDLFMYHGAATGRWAGKGLQPHNFPRDVVKDMESACQEVLDLSPEQMFEKYTPQQVLENLPKMLRGMFTPKPGNKFIVADYSAIELWIISWLGFDKPLLNVLKQGHDAYVYEASKIFHKDVKDIDSDDRFFGKCALLGLGYQMGAARFWEYIRSYTGNTYSKGLLPGDEPFTMDDSDFIKHNLNKLDFDKKAFDFNKDVDTDKIIAQDPDNLNLKYYLFIRSIVINYRRSHPSIPRFWKEIEYAAIEAVKNPGIPVELGKITWFCKKSFLLCKLPSGRCLFYYRPKIGTGSFGKDAIWYKQPNMAGRFLTMTTYGGKLVENVVQAVARDRLAYALIQLEKKGKFPVVLHIHDEVVSEVEESNIDLDEFLSVMNDTPPWMEDCPVKATGWIGNRYTKE